MAVKSLFSVGFTIVIDFVPKFFKYACIRWRQKKKELSKGVLKFKPGTFEEIGGKYYRHSIVLSPGSMKEYEDSVRNGNKQKAAVHPSVAVEL